MRKILTSNNMKVATRIDREITTTFFVPASPNSTLLNSIVQKEEEVGANMK